MKCKGCHSPELRTLDGGLELTLENLQSDISKYKGMISCVLFLGGDWSANDLEPLIAECKRQQLKVCLYSGKRKIKPTLYKLIDYAKLGHWDERKGGLDSPTTNQVFIDTKTNQILNHKFTR